eukprot:3052839-Karenia_brevis.AAC.1
MNVLVGIVVERTMVAANQATELDAKARREQKMQVVHDLVKIFAEIDDSDDAIVTLEKLEHIKDIDTFKHMMDKFDFPPGFSMSDLYLILDEDGDGEISYSEFIN